MNLYLSDSDVATVKELCHMRDKSFYNVLTHYNIIKLIDC